MALCKKHGKERDSVVTSRPNKGGRTVTYVGCVDCKAGLPATVTPADGGPQKAKGAKRGPKRTPPEPPPPAPKKDDPPPAAKKRSFLGFAF